MKTDDKLEYEIVRAYNKVRDLIWIGDLEGAREVILKLKKLENLKKFLEEEEKWLKVLSEIRQKLQKIPEKEREEKESQMIREESEKIDVNKVIMGTLWRELDKLGKITSTLPLDFFSDKAQKPVKEKNYAYLLLEKTQRKFEVRALIKPLPKKDAIKMLRRVVESYGYTTSEPYIGNNSFTIELYSPEAYIEVCCLYPRVLITLSFHKPIPIEEVKKRVELILSAITRE